MQHQEIDILKRALAREKAARKEAESILETKSTELYQLSKKLNASHKELQTLNSKINSQLVGVFETIADAYVVIDTFGNILKMNKPAAALLGYNSINDKANLMRVVAPEELQRIAPSFKELLKTGSITDFKLHIITDTQQKKFVHINASVIYENGIPVGVQGIVRDITEENIYKKALLAEKQKYSNIIANMNLGLVEVNLNDEIQLVNHSFTEMSGYTEDYLLGQQARKILPIKGQEKVIHQETGKRNKGESNTYEVQVQTKDKQTRCWLISGAPNYDINGNIIGSIGVHLDITDLRKLQVQKEKLLRKLEKSNKELEEYAHIVSHDLKSPLRSIDALIHWIKDDNKGRFDEATLQNFEHIELTIEKMDHLISDILDYSSLNQSTTVKKQVHLQQLIANVITILYVPKHITITIAPNLPTVNGDAVKLQQLFQNLISNAVKFIDKPKGEIYINVEHKSTYYQFSVSDNGIGIDAKYHKQIFEIFNSLKKTKDSTGIGLSIVKKIVDIHEGEIWLESKKNKGTTFYFTLKK